VKKRVVWVPHWGCSKYPGKKPRRSFGSFISLSALPFLNRHSFNLFNVNSFRKCYMDILGMAQSVFIFLIFPWYIAFPSYRELTSPNTILQFILLVFLVFVISIIPEFVPTSRFSDSWWSAFDDYACVSIVGPVWQSTMLRRWSKCPIIVIIEYEKMWKWKGIRIMCFIICIHCYGIV